MRCVSVSSRAIFVGRRQFVRRSVSRESRTPPNGSEIFRNKLPRREVVSENRIARANGTDETAFIITTTAVLSSRVIDNASRKHEDAIKETGRVRSIDVVPRCRFASERGPLEFNCHRAGRRTSKGHSSERRNTTGAPATGRFDTRRGRGTRALAEHYEIGIW